MIKFIYLLIISYSLLAPSYAANKNDFPLEVIPGNDSDLSQIKRQANEIAAAAGDCDKLVCPAIDCDRAVTQLQQLINTQQLLEDMIKALERIQMGASNHFVTLGEGTAITGTTLANNQDILAITQFLHDFSSALQTLVSLTGNLDGLKDFKNIESFKKLGGLKALKEITKGLDSLNGAVKDSTGVFGQLLQGLTNGGNADFELTGESAKQASAVSDAAESAYEAIGTTGDIKDNILDLIEVATKFNPNDVTNPKQLEAAFKSKVNARRLALQTLLARLLTAASKAQIEALKKRIDNLTKSQKAETVAITRSANAQARVTSRLFAARDAKAAVALGISKLMACINKLCGNFSVQRPSSIYDGKSDCSELQQQVLEIKKPKKGHLTKDDIETLKEFIDQCGPSNVLRKINPLLDKAIEVNLLIIQVSEDCPPNDSVRPSVKTCPPCLLTAEKHIDAIIDLQRLKSKASSDKDGNHSVELQILQDRVNQTRQALTECELKKCKKQNLDPFEAVNVPPFTDYVSTPHECPYKPDCPSCQKSADIACKHDLIIFQAQEDIKFADTVLKDRLALLNRLMASLEHRANVLRKRILSLSRSSKRTLNRIILKAKIDLEIEQEKGNANRLRVEIRSMKNEITRIENRMETLKENAKDTLRKHNPLLARASRDFVSCNIDNKIPCKKPFISFLPPQEVEADYIIIGDPKTNEVIVLEGDDVADPQQVDPSNSSDSIFNPVTAGSTSNTSTSVSRLCPAITSGAFSGNNGCGISSVTLSLVGSSVSLSSFGANGTVSFNGTGTSGTSPNTNLTIFGQGNHTCSISCTSSTTFTLNCTNPNPGTCSEPFSK